MSKNSYGFVMDIISRNNIKLSRAEESIVSLMKQGSYDISDFDINEFSHTFFVSNATATRFSQKLGFKGYQELRFAIKSDDDGPIYKSLKIYEDMLAGLDSLSDELTSFIKSIDSFNKIAVIGIGSSGLVANEFVYKLNELGIKNSDYAKEPYAINLMTHNLRSDDLLIALSLSGENTNILEGVDIARENGTTILSLTNNPNSSLAIKSNYIFKTPSYSTYGVNISKMTPLLICLDIICEIYAA